MEYLEEPNFLRKMTLAFFVLLTLVACSSVKLDSQQTPLCSPAWYQSVDYRLVTSDGQGHGPDVGADEWKSVVEFRLGIRGKAGIPARNSEEWCRYIDNKISAVRLSKTHDQSEMPSFDCNVVRPGSTEDAICKDESLITLDLKLAAVYAQAVALSANEQPPHYLAAEQRGWIKGRNDCWKSNDERSCIADSYTRRITELQAKYKLVSQQGPIFYYCNNQAANEVVVTFFQTEPLTLIAERGDSVSLMYKKSGEAIYEGRNESFKEQEGNTWITWGYGTAAMACEKK